MEVSIVKIEIDVKDNSNGDCSVQVNKPKIATKGANVSTDDEKKVGNMIHDVISKAVKNIAKEN